MKTCKVCKQIKNSEEFYACNKGKNSHSSCKICFKAKTLTCYKEKRAERIVQMREWAKMNRTKIRKAQRDHNQRRYYSDPNFRLARVLRARLGMALKGNYKAGSAVRDLGCSIPDLRVYLEQLFRPKMTWENYGSWQIDHKIALANFDLTNPAEFKKATHFTNLQPMWAKENQSKGKK